MDGRYIIGDGARVGRGDFVDWTCESARRERGEIIVIESGWAWVQFPQNLDPCKYPLIELSRAAPPDFRAFYAERYGPAWPAVAGTKHDDIIRQLADALAEYANLLKGRP